MTQVARASGHVSGQNRAEKMCSSGIGGNIPKVTVSDKALKMCNSGLVKKPVVVEEPVVGTSFDGSEVVVDSVEFGVEESAVSVNDHTAVNQPVVSNDQLDHMMGGVMDVLDAAIHVNSGDPDGESDAAIYVNSGDPDCDK